MINNAGFCRDKTIFGMSDDEFDSVVTSASAGAFRQHAQRHCLLA